jgi:hypothetical protein
MSGGTVARLQDGRVLVIAYDDGGNLKPQVFDPGTGKVTPTGPVAVQADTLSATMSDGRVLVLGTLYGSRLAEVYDPATNKFIATASTAVDRGYSSSMATLHDGRLLVVGAEKGGTVEVYNPQTGAFSTVSPMPKPMNMTTCTTLADGRVLVIGTVIGEKQPQYGFAPGSGGTFPAGGLGGTLYDRRPATSRSRAPDYMTGPFNYTGELYNPATNRWTVIGHLNIQRTSPALVALRDGRALIVGGLPDSAEFFNPKTNKFTLNG